MAETVLDDAINYELPVDATGNLAYAAQFRHQRTLQLAGAVLALALLASLGMNLWLVRRPPLVLVVRVDELGRAEAVRYNSLDYTPRESEVRARLNEWATYRYRLLKAVAGSKFQLNYDYLSAGLAQRLMPQDAPRLAKILAGNEPEQDVAIDNIQFTAIETQKLPDGAVASGEAVIDLTKIIDSNGRNERHRWTVSLRYEVDPVQAVQRGESDPQFQILNPLGVTITWFHEDRAFR
ncbi:MAG TPA: VirB8/TrbF family protein [Terracidiphilus sp.]|nr:VirB8/TrbF family protein [Terracidiphilus sp.]